MIQCGRHFSRLLRLAANKYFGAPLRRQAPETETFVSFGGKRFGSSRHTQKMSMVPRWRHPH
jgi:hypothetical protein